MLEKLAEQLPEAKYPWHPTPDPKSDPGKWHFKPFWVVEQIRFAFCWIHLTLTCLRSEPAKSKDLVTDLSMKNFDKQIYRTSSGWAKLFCSPRLLFYFHKSRKKPEMVYKSLPVNDWELNACTPDRTLNIQSAVQIRESQNFAKLSEIREFFPYTHDFLIYKILGISRGYIQSAVQIRESQNFAKLNEIGEFVPY